MSTNQHLHNWGCFLLDKLSYLWYNKDMKNNKDNKTEIVMFRVTLAEKLELINKAKDSKNLSTYLRHLLKLDEK